MYFLLKFIDPIKSGRSATAEVAREARKIAEDEIEARIRVEDFPWQPIVEDLVAIIRHLDFLRGMKASRRCKPHIHATGTTVCTINFSRLALNVGTERHFW